MICLCAPGRSSWQKTAEVNHIRVRVRVRVRVCVGDVADARFVHEFDAAWRVARVCLFAIGQRRINLAGRHYGTLTRRTHGGAKWWRAVIGRALKTYDYLRA